jgi:hypothetical protein
VISWNNDFHFAFLAEVSQQQENPGQTSFAGVEELTDEIRFVPDVAVQQVGDEQLRDAGRLDRRGRGRLCLRLNQGSAVASRDGSGSSIRFGATPPESWTSRLASAGFVFMEETGLGV